MKYLKSFFTFWYHFIVGDDWRIAAAVIIGLALVAFLVHKPHDNAWWLLPLLVISMLTLSLWFAVRRPKD